MAVVEQYALLDHPTGSWWFYIGAISGSPHIGARELVAGAERGWWRADIELVGVDPSGVVIELHQQPRRVVSHYKRAVLAPDYPEWISVEQYADLVGEGAADADRRAAAMYESVMTTREVDPEVITGPWKVLEGAPPPADGRVWVADLPYTLRFWPQYRHLFPGHLTGFAEALVAALEAIPQVSARRSGPGPVVDVYVHVMLPSLDPIPFAATPHPARRSRKAGSKEREPGEEKTTRHLKITVPGIVKGNNRVEASREWDDLMSQYVAYIESITANVCDACGGRGFVETRREDHVGQNA